MTVESDRHPAVHRALAAVYRTLRDPEAGAFERLEAVRDAAAKIEPYNDSDALGELTDVATETYNLIVGDVQTALADGIIRSREARDRREERDQAKPNGKWHGIEQGPYGLSENPAPQNLPNLEGIVLDLADWLKRNLPKPDRVLGFWLTTTSRAMLYAPTGLGKTMLGLGIGMAVAAGNRFLRWAGCRPRRVLYIDGEMSRELLQERLADEVRRLGSMPEGFHALSHEDIENFAPLNTPEGQSAIERVIEMIGGVDLIIFDNIMALIGGDHKDEEGWRRALPWIKSLTKQKIGQIWIHHTGHDSSHSYGTKTREWQMDTVIKAEEAKRPDTDISLTLKFEKARGRRPETRTDFADTTIALIDDRWTYSDGDAAAADRRKLSDRQRLALDALTEAILNYGQPAPATFGIPAGIKVATADEWRAELIRQRVLDPESSNPRARFDELRNALKTRHLIGVRDDFVWLPTKGASSPVLDAKLPA